MKPARCVIPATSVLHRMYAQPYYWDAREVPLHTAGARIHQIYLGIFSHYPNWAKTALAIRGRAGRLIGIKGPAFADLRDTEMRDAYRIGEKIGRFTLFYQSENEIVTGGNDRHLDFRVSVMRVGTGDGSSVVLSTVVQPHNLFGKIYLFFIRPFHALGLRTLLANAVTSKRI